MASLAQAKTLGGIGSILIILSIIPYAGAVLGIIGWILTLVAIKYISDVLQDRSIFNNAIISVILAIVGVAIAGLVIAGAVFGAIGLGSVSSNSPSSGVFGFIAAIIVGLVALWIIAIVSSYFLRKSYNTISTRLNIGMFHTGALIYFIGAILTVILIGFLLIFIAEILFIVAFFSIPENLPYSNAAGFSAPPPPMGTPASMGGAPMTGVTKYCPNCGSSLDSAATFCPHCGARQQ